MQGTLAIDDKFTSETTSSKAAVLVELTDVELYGVNWYATDPQECSCFRRSGRQDGSI